MAIEADVMDRFDSVTDRFRVELGPVAAGQVPKDLDFRYEYLVKGLQYVRIKVCLTQVNLCHLY